MLAKGKTATGRLWVYLRDDRPFAGGAPPAALFRFSRDRKGEHPAPPQRVAPAAISPLWLKPAA